MSSSEEKLLEIISSVQVSRTLIHSLVYLLEHKYGFKIGYRDCKWRLTATGLYCNEVEQAIRKLEKLGFIQIGSEGMIKPCNGREPPSLEKEEAYHILKEAANLYILSRSVEILNR